MAGLLYNKTAKTQTGSFWLSDCDVWRTHTYNHTYTYTYIYIHISWIIMTYCKHLSTQNAWTCQNARGRDHNAGTWMQMHEHPWACIRTHILSFSALSMLSSLDDEQSMNGIKLHQIAPGSGTVFDKWSWSTAATDSADSSQVEELQTDDEDLSPKAASLSQHSGLLSYRLISIEFDILWICSMSSTHYRQKLESR